MRIEPYSPSRALEIADLFHAAVHAVDSSIYTPEQKEAWAPTPPDYTRWAERLDTKRPFMAIIGDRVAGFMELDPDGHIDCTYTHPDLQRQGVASALYEHLLAEAARRKMTLLYVDASHGARPFFERRGFSMVSQHEVHRNGVTLTNFSMEKYLSTAGA